jgi:AcrR family transcriptional regulator
MRPSGRPRRDSSTREAILTAARALFAEAGYDRASIRAIARRAGVDPALVHHYFGTKDDLLLAAVQLPIDPASIFAQAFEQPDMVGEVLIRSVLMLWDTPDIRDRMLALLRAAVTHPGAASILRTVLTRDVLAPVTERIDLPNAELRVELAGTHLIGLAMARYVLRVEPLASASVNQLATAVGPTLQRYLADPELA